MNRIMFLSIMILLVMTACGLAENSVDFPPERPVSIISGTVSNGALINAHISAYAFRNGGKQELLASSDVDESGNFEISIKTKSQPVWIETEGGYYVETVSKEQIPLVNNEGFVSLAYYRTGKDLHVELSPLTSIASIVFQQELSKMQDFESAYRETVNKFDELLGFNVFDLQVPNINQSDNDETSFKELNALYLAAFSGLSAWFAFENAHEKQSVFNTISLTHIMQQDLLSDGVLDGFGSDEKSSTTRLAIGNVLISANVYRLGLAQHLIASTKEIDAVSSQEKVSIAKSLLKTQSELLGEDDSDLAQQLAPKLYLDSTQMADIQGEQKFRIQILSYVDIESLSLSVDDSIVMDQINLNEPTFTIDSKNYIDGKHLLGVNVIDILGSHNRIEVPVVFNNTRIGVLSPAITNQVETVLRGLYTANKLTAIKVNGKAVDNIDENSWSSSVTLEKGGNDFTIEIIDNNNYREQLEIRIVLDLSKPEIMSDGLHGEARFSNLQAGFAVQTMTDENIDAPLYFESDQLALQGLPIARESLLDKKIPFFAFQILDSEGESDPQVKTNLKVFMQYFRNDQLIIPQTQLSANGSEYLIPLVAEILGAEWYRSSALDEHRIEIMASDRAGNVQTKNFRFKADIYVPEIEVTKIDDYGNEIFMNTIFSERQNLNQLELKSNGYEFTNNTGKGFYLQFQDQNIHQAELIVEEMVRKHLYRTRERTEWRAGLVKNVLVNNECPRIEIQNVVPVSEILNYTNAQGWLIEKPATDIFGEVMETNSDDLPVLSNSYTDWLDISARFTSELADFKLENLPGNINLSYQYDLLVNSHDLTTTAWVKNWWVSDLENENNLNPVACLPVGNAGLFEERKYFVNESVEGYPKNISESYSEFAEFSTTRFQAFDKDSGQYIESENEWYFIPAGHRIEISKFVELPILQFYNDLSVSDESSFDSYIAKQLDKSLRWNVKRDIQLVTRFAAGLENLDLMSQRQQAVGAGEKQYLINR